MSTPGTWFGDHFTWVAGWFYSYSSGGGNPFNFVVAPGLIQALGNSALGPTGIQAANALLGVLNPITTLAGVNLSSGIPLQNYGVIAGLSNAGYFQEAPTSSPTGST